MIPKERLKCRLVSLLGNIKNNLFMFNFNKKEKSASAILLGLIIMSTILSSTLYINFLSMRSMKQSLNIDNSIVAFYAAETGNEQAIYYIRKVEDLDIAELQIPKIPAGQILGPDSLVSRVVDDEVTNVLIALEKDETYQLDIFDQENLSSPSSISYLALRWNDNCDSDSIIEMTSNEWLAQEDIEWGIIQKIYKCLLYSSPTTIDGSGDICSDIELDPDNSYQFRFKSLNCDIHNFSIRAFDMGGELISFKNIYTIESVGEYPLNKNVSNRQALRVNLRKFSPLSGLFDYVIFSEKSLVKDVGVYNQGWFGGELLISTSNLPNATQGASYYYPITAVNGTPPYSWSLLIGDPPGLSIGEDTGILQGDIGGEGPFLLRIQVTDEEGDTDSKTLFLEVDY